MRLCEIFPTELTQQKPSFSKKTQRPGFPEPWFTVTVDNLDYDIGFMKYAHDVYTVHITEPQSSPPPGREGHHARTIFAEALKHVFAFLGKNQPKAMMFKPLSAAHEKLYRRLLQRYASALDSLGYHVTEKDASAPGGRKTFILMHKEPLKEMSMQDLRDAEYVIEYLFKDLGLDVVWTAHFRDRIQGREADVTKFELADAFKKMKEKYGDRLLAARNNHKEFVGVLKDLASELNIPFAIEFDHRNPLNNKYKLHGITIMRKDPKRFKTNIGGGAELQV